MRNEWLERRLGVRLLTVAAQVEGRVAADIGSDHGLLPAWLLQRGQVERMVVVEKNPGPYARARRALTRVNAEVRYGNGLGPVKEGELDCLVLSGLGARTIVEVLQAHPERVPARLVVQPQKDPELVLAWARSSGHQLVAWQTVAERFPVLTLQRP